MRSRRTVCHTAAAALLVVSVSRPRPPRVLPPTTHTHTHALQVMERRVPRNPKYEDVGAVVDSGRTVKKIEHISASAVAPPHLDVTSMHAPRHAQARPLHPPIP